MTISEAKQDKYYKIYLQNLINIAWLNQFREVEAEFHNSILKSQDLISAYKIEKAKIEKYYNQD